MGLRIIDNCRLWVNGIVPYTINTQQFPVGQQANNDILGAIQHWNDNTMLRLIPRTNEPDFVIDFLRKSINW